MSKKTLLEEGTIRQFMKYANLGHLTENYLDEAEEPVEEGAGHYMEDEEGMADMADDMPADDMEMDMEPEADMADEEEAMADTSEASVEALVDALADTITQVTGVEVTAAGDADMAPMGDEPPVDDMADAPMDDAEMAMADEAPMGDEEEVMRRRSHVEEKAHEEEETMDEEAVIEETMKRVMARLQEMKKGKAEAKKREDLIEAVAAAVEKRLASK
jgi:hypothetical protein